MVETILWALIGGTIIGILGRAFAPRSPPGTAVADDPVRDRRRLPRQLALRGRVQLQRQHFGLDWWRHVWQIAVAAILVVVATSVTGRGRTKAIEK